MVGGVLTHLQPDPIAPGNDNSSGGLLGDDARSSSIAQLRMKAKEHSATMATMSN